MEDHPSGPGSAYRGVTLNGLKDQLYSLNMRMLLAMQNHDKEAQEDVQKQLAAVQAEIDRMCAGYSRRFPGRTR